MTSWRPPGGSWAPAGPQVAAQAALRSHLWAGLGVLLAALGIVLGLSPRFSSSGGGSGIRFWVSFLEVGPGRLTFHMFGLFVVCFLSLFDRRTHSAGPGMEKHVGIDARGSKKDLRG